MRKCRIKAICSCWMMLLMVVPALAEPAGPGLSRSRRANWQTGRYATNRSANEQVFSLSGNMLYYYGDMDNAAFIFKNGFNAQNVGFMLNGNYVQPLGNSGVNMRYSLGGGMLRGDGMGGSLHIDSLQRQRSFKSAIGRVAVGVEWYPFVQAGLYLHAGVAMTMSRVTLDFSNGSLVLQDVKRNVFGLMVPLELGYNWRLGDNWMLGAHVAWTTCLMDKDKWNLDGYPYKEYNIGMSQYNRQPDGWLEVGVTVGYIWHRCIDCGSRRR